MELTIQTPALLFPALSLLILAFTNKFLAIASLIRKLATNYEQKQQLDLFHQINSLNRRLGLIRWMQVFGIGSMLLCVVTMFLIYAGCQLSAQVLFGISLMLMIIALIFSLVEIILSAGALKIILNKMENIHNSNNHPKP
jgi:hypothetical protein